MEIEADQLRAGLSPEQDIIQFICRELEVNLYVLHLEHADDAESYLVSVVMSEAVNATNVYVAVSHAKDV